MSTLLLAAVHALDKQYSTPGPGGDNGFWWVRLVARLRPGDRPEQLRLRNCNGVFRNLAADSTGAALQPKLELVHIYGRVRLASVRRRT